MTLNLRRALLGSFAFLLLGACAQIREYRVELQSCTLNSPGGTHASEAEKDLCPTSAVVRVAGEAPYELAYVEVDEQGMLANRRQAESALDLAGAPSKSGRPVHVLVFVHGWHHNAQAGDENVKDFHEALAAISRWHNGEEVRGIYVGWRGDSLAIKGLRYFTFWDRKNTSDEVGRGALYEFLVRLERSVKPVPASPNKLVLVGHSFGASVAFNSLAQLYLQRFLEGVYASGPGRRFRGYGDLVVLINPAIEAMRYMPFQSALEYYSTLKQTPPRADFSSDVIPVLMILSSEGDWATRITFPAARFFSTFPEAHLRISPLGPEDGKNRSYSEWVMDIQAVGNYAGFDTHHTISLSPGAKPEDILGCPALPNGELVRKILASAGSEQAFPNSGVVIKRNLEPSTTAAPYWHASLSKKIVKDHTSIVSVNLICWINQMVTSK